jgi:hypothetical protein
VRPGSARRAPRVPSLPAAVPSWLEGHAEGMLWVCSVVRASSRALHVPTRRRQPGRPAAPPGRGPGRDADRDRHPVGVPRGAAPAATVGRGPLAAVAGRGACLVQAPGRRAGIPRCVDAAVSRGADRVPAGRAGSRTRRLSGDCVRRAHRRPHRGTHRALRRGPGERRHPQSRRAPQGGGPATRIRRERLRLRRQCPRRPARLGGLPHRVRGGAAAGGPATTARSPRSCPDLRSWWDAVARRAARPSTAPVGQEPAGLRAVGPDPVRGDGSGQATPGGTC